MRYRPRRVSSCPPRLVARCIRSQMLVATRSGHLTQRTVLAAGRGYGRIFQSGIAPPPGTAARPTTLADDLLRRRRPRHCSATSPQTGCSRVGGARIEPAAGRKTHRISCWAPPGAGCSGGLRADGDVRLAAVESGLLAGSVRRRRCRKIDPLVVATPRRSHGGTSPAALGKDTDGFMARHFDRHFLADFAASSAHRVNQPNLRALGAIGVCGAPFSMHVGRGSGALPTATDRGWMRQVARLKFRNQYGGIVDFWGTTRPLPFPGTGDRLGPVGRRDLAIVARRRGDHRHAGIGQLRVLASVAGQGGQRPAFYVGFRRSQRSSGWDARCRVTPRLHLSRPDSCAIRQVELAAAFGRDRSADILSPAGLSCSARTASEPADNVQRLIADWETNAARGARPLG